MTRIIVLRRWRKIEDIEIEWKSFFRLAGLLGMGMAMFFFIDHFT